MTTIQNSGKPAKISVVPTTIKAENDNGVYAALEPVQGDGNCDSAPVVLVERDFRAGGLSRSHALRFAAWLVHIASVEAGHGDFIAVLDAVEREDPS